MMNAKLIGRTTRANHLRRHVGIIASCSQRFDLVRRYVFFANLMCAILGLLTDSGSNLFASVGYNVRKRNPLGIF